MGRFAQVLGIGVRGEVHVELPKREFFAGEFVVGHVKLNVHEAIDAEGFTLTLHGKERISWHVQQGKHEYYRHVKHEIIRQSISLVTAPVVFSPGEYIYPFQFQLPMGLPSSYSIYRPRLDSIKRVASSILYKLKAEINVRGMLMANLGTERTIGVHGFPPPPPPPPSIRPVEEQCRRPVYLLCCFDQGLCQLCTTMSVDAVDLFHGVASLRIAVRNESTRAIIAINVRLMQEMAIHIPQQYDHGGVQYAANEIMHKATFPGVGAHGNTEFAVELSLPQILTAIAQKKKKASDLFGDLKKIQQPCEQVPILSTRDTIFASIRYHISVECAIAWSPDIVIELPLTIYMPAPVFVAHGAAEMPPLIPAVVVEEFGATAT